MYSNGASDWYALQVYHSREERLSAELSSRGWEVFLPKRYVERADGSGRIRRVLVPVVHSLLFVRCPCGGERLLGAVLSSCPYACRVYPDSSGRWCRIRESEMAELRAVSDPSYTDTLYVDTEFASARPGSPVRVVRGPFHGLEGRLVRYRNRSYVVLVVASLGVMVHVPKWYCRPLPFPPGG